MDPDHVQVAVDLGRRALYVSLLLSIPLLGVGMIVGVVISILQAATQIQEQTLTFVPKIIAVIVALFIGLPWFIEQMISFTREIVYRMPTLFT